MKKKPILSAAALAVMLILNTGAYAQSSIYSLSPGLEILSESVSLVKCTTTAKDISFTREDFESTTGTPLDYITVTSLPSRDMGVLKYAGADVQRGQDVPAQNLGLLRFVPGNSTGNASFEFCADGNTKHSITCDLSILDKQNLAPYGEDMSASALSGIGLVKSLDIYDPDGDDVSVEISGYPGNGVVKLCGNSFVYTALPTYSGKDSFSYSVKDRYGNISQTANVTLEVRKPQTDVRYDDMRGHWGYTSAVKMAELGLMQGKYTDGKYVFDPDAPVTRGDFLAMAMISAGLESEVQKDAVTTFADDTDIPANIRSYASYAKANGIINGYATKSGESFFDSTSGITRAEAASVLSAIIGDVKTVSEFDFVDTASVPAWAKDSFASLTGLGIINGSPDGALMPHSTLTRAQTAQILCNTLEYLEAQEAR